MGVAGCLSGQRVGLDLADSNDAASATSGVEQPTGESIDFEWESFEYPSLEGVIKRREWDDAATVRIIETPEFDDILAVSRTDVPDFVEYIDRTDFAKDFVIVTDLFFSKRSYSYEIRDVISESDEELVVHAFRAGTGDDADGMTVGTVIRVPRAVHEVPAAVRVAVEREHPREEEDEWRQFATYPIKGFTGFAILMEDEDGEFVAEGYPDQFSEGENYEFVYVVENHESRSQEYTVVTELQRVDTDNLEVEERDELDRFTTTVEYGTSRPHKRTITPTMTGENLRLVLLLFEGESPDEPTKENAYRHLHLWIDVEE